MPVHVGPTVRSGVNQMPKNNSSSSRLGAREFSAAGFLVRLLGTATMIFATYNPSGWSFFHWARESFASGSLGPAQFVVGIVLVIGWIILLTATSRSMGALGLILGSALFAGLVWLLVDLGWLNIDSRSDLTWVVLVVLSFLLAIGLSWSHVWRRLTGQYSTDDID